MTLDQLRIFVAVAERQHFTRAAEALNLVKSEVSAAVNALETRHAVKLVHRVGRGIELTEAGRIFLGEARAVLARAQAAELVLADLSGLRRGTLAVRASQTIASHGLPRHLAAVVAGAGASVLSESVVGPSVRTGALVAVPLALPTRTLQVLRHRERYRSRAADTRLAMIRAAP